MRFGFQVARFAGADHAKSASPTFVVFGAPSAYEQPIPDRHRRQAINAWLTSDQAEIGTPTRATPKPSRKVSLFARSPSSRPIETPGKSGIAALHKRNPLRKWGKMVYTSWVR
jgi:hypothetical protein